MSDSFCLIKLKQCLDYFFISTLMDLSMKIIEHKKQGLEELEL